MLHEAATIFSHHCNLAYIPLPTMLVAELSKRIAQRLLHRWSYLAQFQYITMHILREDTYWGDLLSRWGRAGTGADGEVSGSSGCCKIAVSASTHADYSLPTKSAIKSR